MKNSRKNMTHYALAIMFLTAFTAKMAGQGGEIGVRAMPTLTALSLNTSSGGTIKGQATVGYGIGAFVAFNFNDHVGVQVEGIYTSISQKYVENNIDKTLNLKYVNIPLLLSLNTNKSLPVNFNIVAGPQMGINVGSSMKMSGNADTSNVQTVIAVKRNDLGLAYGAGLDFGLNPAQNIRLGIGFRGVLGLLDISDHSRTVTNDSYYLLDRTHIKTYSMYIGVSVIL